MVPRTFILRFLAGVAITLLITVPLVLIKRAGREAPPTTAPPVVTTPSTPAPAALVQFPTLCTPLTQGQSRPLGIGIPRPARLKQDPIEGAVFTAAADCLQRMTGQKPMLRTQLPIDVMRRRTAPDNEYAELTAFAEMLKSTGAAGIVSIRAHDFTRCSSRGDQRPQSRATLKPGEALQSCEYPSLPLYEQLFGELHDELLRLAPGADLSFSAWNEPDHPMFTLQPGYGRRVAARRAGKYWSVVAGIVGAERALAGEFSDQDLPTLNSLRDAFVDGAGGLTPAVWALHPYRDLTAGNAEIETGFGQTVAPSAVWVTEANPRISGAGGLSGRPAGQRRRGIALRGRLAESKAPLILYLLTPPAPPTNPDDDGWDSALADRAGSARPFLCGLADLPVEQCPGDPAAFGG